MEQVLPYFKEADKLLTANDFPTTDDLSVFLQNVFTELNGMEKRMACHHDGSQMLERFLGKSGPEQLRSFFAGIEGEMVKLTVHRYASHVMEALLKRSDTVLASGDAEGLPEMIIKLSTEIGEAFDVVTCNAWGSHVYRSLINLLQTHASFIPAFENELAAIFENVSLSETGFLRDLAFDAYGSPAFQSIIAASVGSLFSNQIVSKLLGTGDDSSAFLLKAARNDHASHVIEAVVKTLDSSAFLSFYSGAVRPHFADLLSGTPSNFLLQHVITACHSQVHLKIILEDLTPHLDGLVAAQRAGMLVRLAAWAAEHKAAHEPVISAVFKAFHAKSTGDKKRIFERILRLRVEDSALDGGPVNNLGCTLLGALSAFPVEMIKALLDNILDMDAETLMSLSQHQSASRALESFLGHGCFSEKALARLVRRLHGRLAAMATDRCGSHVVERLWAASPTDQKSVIMAELALARSRLDSTQHGRIVLKRCRVEDFERKRQDWVQAEESAQRKKAMFADLLEDQEQLPKNKKKKKKTTEESLLLTEDI